MEDEMTLTLRRFSLSRMLLMGAILILMLSVMAIPSGAQTTPVQEILLTEIVVTPTAGEFVEIFNPTASAIDLSDYYLTDATFAGGSTYYYNIVTGTNAGGGSFGDFLARFPDGASIGAGEYQTIAMTGSVDFFSVYGSYPTYELFDDGTANGEQVMREGIAGSINGQGGLTNGGEVVILFYWDGASDLVTDVDYVVWGDKDEAVDKTGVVIDGPDADADTSAYLPDTAIASQDVIETGAHAFGVSWQREDLTEGTEATSGGNGVNGEDETSENLSATWCRFTPTPGAATVCDAPPVPDVFINELRISGSPDAEYFELQGDPGTSLDGLAYVVLSGEFSPGQIDDVIDLAGASIPADGFFLAANSTTESSFGVTADLSDGLSFFGSPTTHMIVSGFTGAAGDDLDTNNDGILDTTPWTTVIDSVSLVDGDTTTDLSYSSVVVGPDGSFTPSGTFRCPDAPTGSFDNNQLTFSPLNGTPGIANDCSLPTPELLVINEIDYDQPGTDAAEFVEIRNNDSVSVDLSAYSLVFVNGNGGAVYDTIPLPPVNLAAGDYFVVCANAATVANCDLDDGPDTNFIQNGAPDAVTLYFGSTLVDTVSYEGDTVAPYTEGTGAGLVDNAASATEGISRCPDGSDTNQNNVDFSLREITPGAENTCVTPVTLVKIHEVQGAGAVSPLVGQTVAIEGIVVGDFQDDVGANGDLNGFFVQEEDADADTDPATSEGVFVFQGSNPSVDVAIGDHVRVEGSVSEYNGDTQITSFSGVTVNSSGNPLPAVSVLSLPVATLDDFEAYEGMYVTFPQPLVISEYFNFDRFGEIVLTDARHFQPTAVFEPGSADAANLAVANSLARITLDDGRTNQNPDPALHPNGLEFNLDNLFRGGDTVTDVTGVINYAFGLYRVQPTQGANYTSVNPRMASPDLVGGNVKVASFNVLNYFTTLDDSGPICGPLQNQDCRGADNANEFTRQRDKIIAAIAAIDADVVGLMEIENHIGDVPTADLVSGLNDFIGVAGTYDYIATGAMGSDAIRQAFIYKPANVSPVGAYAVLDTPAFLDPNNTGADKNRPALAQTFSVNSTGGVFTVVVNHLKSKGSGCGFGDDDPEQGSCNLTRTMAAQVMLNWLSTDPTGSGDEDFMIIGDLNSYDKEDPIDVFINGGYTDLAYQYQGEFAYSYVFSGQWGYLDYALANAALLNEVTGATEWHINADEADLIDYDTSFKGPNQDAIYAPDAFRSSDHDPVIVGLELTTEAEVLELIYDVHKLVDAGFLNDGQGNSFTSKLENVLAKLATGQTNAAANQLGAFINQVEDFVAEEILTAGQGDLLIKAAALLVDALE